MFFLSSYLFCIKAVCSHLPVNMWFWFCSRVQKRKNRSKVLQR